MKVTIKKLSKNFTIFMLIFIISSGVLSITASAEASFDESAWSCITYNGITYYRDRFENQVGQFDIKKNNVYALVHGSEVIRVYITEIFEAPRCFNLWTEKCVKGINIENESQTISRCVWDYNFYPMMQVNDSDCISCRGLNYYKYKFGDQVDQYDVKEQTPYLLAERLGHGYFSQRRVFVTRVFENPICFGIFGTSRAVEGIDLDTGKDVFMDISYNMNRNEVYNMIKA